MNYGSALILGLAIFIFGFGFFFVVPDMNFTNWGLDFTTMDNDILYLFRIGFLTLGLFGLYFGVSGGDK